MNVFSMDSVQAFEESIGKPARLSPTRISYKNQTYFWSETEFHHLLPNPTHFKTISSSSVLGGEGWGQMKYSWTRVIIFSTLLRRYRHSTLFGFPRIHGFPNPRTGAVCTWQIDESTLLDQSTHPTSAANKEGRRRKIRCECNKNMCAVYNSTYHII